MGDLNMRIIALMALVISCFLQIGTQLFAVSIVASTIVEAPPRSFAILHGDYRYDSGVADFDAVRRALGYDRIDLFALSYGTLFALRYLATYPTRVRAGGRLT